MILRPVTIYTDGSADNKTVSPGGWGAVYVGENRYQEAMGHIPGNITSSQAELIGAIRALELLLVEHRVTIYVDSAYVRNCFRDRWHKGWIKNGWINSGGEPVKNRSLWERLLAQDARHQIRWRKVKGHSNDVHNERADQLAHAARLQIEPPPREVKET